MKTRVAIVGAGFYGCEIARFLSADRRLAVELIECGEKIMGRASLINQARVHGGYHYLRDLDTALRSRVNFERFCRTYPECIGPDIDHYYGVARHGSLLNPLQFEGYCERIGAWYERADAGVRSLFSAEMVEEIYRVRETSFDAEKLREKIGSELALSGVSVRTTNKATRIRPQSSGTVILDLAHGDPIEVDQVFICAYASVNSLLHRSDLPSIPLQYQLTEMLLLNVVPVLNFAFTLMDGPFFSWFPFPAGDCFSLSHVTYTNHKEWNQKDLAAQPVLQACLAASQKSLADYVTSNATKILRDCVRYMPALSDSVMRRSVFEIKALLPRNSENGGRPIFFAKDYAEQRGVHVVLGGKIDNVFDIIDVIAQMEFFN